jgi:rhomboid protease GluP
MILGYKLITHYLTMVNIQKFPLATTSLIAINLLVFAFGFLTDSHIWLIRNFGFVPDYLFDSNKVDSFRVTYDSQGIRPA